MKDTSRNYDDRMHNVLIQDTRALWNSRYARRAEQSVPLPADPWLSRWLDILEPAREGQILDLGCGEGRTCRYLADRGFRHLLAADLSDEALKICRQSVPEARHLPLDLRQPLPFPDGHFQVVIASLALHYFPWLLTQQIVHEINRCLRDDGVLFVRLNSTRDSNFGAVGHPEIEANLFLVNGELKRFFDRDSVERLFAEEWSIQAMEELTVDTRSMPKVLWELCMRKKCVYKPCL